jgi:hypothetical protein
MLNVYYTCDLAKSTVNYFCRLANGVLYDAYCLVTNNTLHGRLADYAMIGTMSGR